MTTTPNNPTAGTPAAGGLRDAPQQTEEESAFVLEAMDALDDVSDQEGDGVQPVSVPPTDPSPASPAPSPVSGDTPPVSPPAATPPVVNPAAVQAATEQPPVVQPPEPTQPQAQVQGEQAPAVPTGQASAEQGTPEQPEEGFKVLAERIEANKVKVIEAVANNLYKLSEEEQTAVAVEPEKAIPQLLAKVHVHTVQATLQHLAQQLPAVVGGLLTARQHYQEREDRFYKAWPQLDRVKHDGEVRKLAAAYRQLHPNASFEEMTRAVGAQAVVMLGLHQAPPAAVAQPPQALPFAPAAPGAQNGLKPGNRAPANQVEIWDQMLEMDESGAFD